MGENYRRHHVWTKITDARIDFAMQNGFKYLATQCRTDNYLIHIALRGRGFELLRMVEGRMCTGEIVQGYEFGIDLKQSNLGYEEKPFRKDRMPLTALKTAALVLK